MSSPRWLSLFRRVGVLVLLFFYFIPLQGITAAEFKNIKQQDNRPTPADLIAAVNQLRVGRGLHPLNIHPILMKTAQMQADALLASGGAVGHTRPNGLSYTDQLILLGYPLGGDLSMGGYRAENFLSAPPSMKIDEVINMWLGDAIHANTMLSPYYQDIGAGIAIDDDGTVYYVIDCAMPTASGTPQAYTPVSGSVGSNNQEEAIRYIQPVILATARPDGDVIHEVLYGQSLWSIAIAYGVKIEQIQRYNYISDNTIYTGQRLLVQKGATQPVSTPNTTGTVTPDLTRKLTPTPYPAKTNTAAPSDIPITTVLDGVPVDKDVGQIPPSTVFIAGIILVSMLIGGLITWLGNRSKV